MNSKKRSFIFSHSKRHLIIFVLALLTITLIVTLSNTLWHDSFSVHNWFGSWVHPIAEGVTLTIAIYLWVNDKTKEWEDSLEKKLTVHFKYNNKYVLTCHEAYLASEGDIRAWGQSIGQQMIGEPLKFGVWIETVKPNVPENEEYFLYTVTFNLTQLPESGNLNNKYLIWIENENKKPLIYIVDEQPERPIDKASLILNYKPQNNA